MKTAVALSGGADSLASLLLLRDLGHDIMPFHASLTSQSDQEEETTEKLRHICLNLGLSLVMLDLTSDFEQAVIEPFVQSYLKGLTPNPCASCNQQIKFGVMFHRVRSMGASFMATGHYAGIFRDKNGVSLCRAKDRSKDQSYFLSLVPADTFLHVIFPLHQMSKAQTLEFLRQKNVTPPVQAESNEICFIKTDYRDYLSNMIPDHSARSTGPIINRQGMELGRHKGLWRYTQGQRKGLGIAHEHPLYVLGKDCSINALIVGSRKELLTETCVADLINLHTPAAQWPDKVFVQTRYRQKAGEASVTIIDNRMHINFCQPRDIPAPGQVAAVYSEHGRIMAAGIIVDKE